MCCFGKDHQFPCIIEMDMTFPSYTVLILGYEDRAFYIEGTNTFSRELYRYERS